VGEILEDRRGIEDDEEAVVSSATRNMPWNLSYCK
jgi:hypothetical protein